MNFSNRFNITNTTHCSHILGNELGLLVLIHFRYDNLFNLKVNKWSNFKYGVNDYYLHKYKPLVAFFEALLPCPSKAKRLLWVKKFCKPVISFI